MLISDYSVVLCCVYLCTIHTHSRDTPWMESFDCREYIHQPWLCSPWWCRELGGSTKSPVPCTCPPERCMACRLSKEHHGNWILPFEMALVTNSTQFNYTHHVSFEVDPWQIGTSCRLQYIPKNMHAVLLYFPFVSFLP